MKILFFIFLGVLCFHFSTFAQAQNTELGTDLTIERITEEDEVYIYILERIPYSQASTACSQYNARLLIIDDEDVQDIVVDHLNEELGVLPYDNTWESRFAPGYWVGGTDYSREGNWEWADGSPIPVGIYDEGYENWYRQGSIYEPNSRFDNCLYISGVFLRNFPNILGAWFDSNCNFRKYAICKVDQCLSSPCQNRGSCSGSGTSFYCTCPQGYFGARCQNRLTACTNSPCQNGGRCVLQNLRSFRCVCINEFYGDLCENRGWLPWTPWSSCPTTCGIRTRFRNRVCPASVPGSQSCPGQAREEQNCLENLLCPTWSPWDNWSPCQISCGNSVQFRHRVCQHGSTCQGFNRDTRPCSVPCPSWGAWSPYGQCSRTCGRGNQIRVRTCRNGEIGDRGCGRPEDAVSSRECATNPCSQWSEWSQVPCAATCGESRTVRTRFCIGGFPGLPGCLGPVSQTVNCRNPPCPSWSSWTDGSCPVTCGGGTIFRTRVCIRGLPSDCSGDDVETLQCNSQPCIPERPARAWRNWSGFSSCSATCGNGTLSRTRTCMGGEPGDPGCEGSRIDVRVCIATTCPTMSSVMWGEWGMWQPCAVTCGMGTQLRVRSCPVENSCDGSAVETRNCSMPCWGEWTPCPNVCGGGQQFRTRACVFATSSQPGCNNFLQTESRDCAADICCSEWSNWETTDCSVSCGNGTATRQRVCNTRDPSCFPDCVGDASEVVRCSNPACWTGWTDLVLCTKTCGSGFRVRSRVCLGDTCEGNRLQSSRCAETPCEMWGDWSAYTTCTATCGGGVQARSRSCVGGESGSPGCLGPDRESSPCNTDSCCSYAPWVENPCSVSCGNGVIVRERELLAGNVAECIGGTSELDTCSGPPCTTSASLSWSQWSEFSECLSDCGEGIRVRTRTCGDEGEENTSCPGTGVDIQPCSNPPCPEE